MRKETFKNADYPNRKAGNSSLYNTKLSEEDKAINQGYKFLRWQVGKPFVFSNQKAFEDGEGNYNIYQKVS